MTQPRFISSRVLEEAKQFFEERGAHGLEGTAMIAARSGDGSTRLVIPTQRAGRMQGCWVEVPLEGKLELAAALAADEQYIARIHSHPGSPFHSDTDDRNPVLTQQGALSIVVPFFGLGLRLGLDACRVYVREGGTWLEFPPGQTRDHWVRVV